ncbi:MAG: hypothetical protein GOU97_04210 [Nanoarchaeota archaeon]|nr:hypothetical protein [Nanoarchaeota archaeon]
MREDLQFNPEHVSFENNGETIVLSVRTLQKKDADKLVELFSLHYEQKYELDDVYEKEWWVSQVDNSSMHARVFVDSLDQVIGTFIVESEEEERRITIGKVVVDPIYLSKGVSRQLGSIALKDIMTCLTDEGKGIEMMYSEARTNKPTTQRFLHKSFARPVALFPSKLSVQRGLESALLMILPIPPDKRIKKKPVLLKSLLPFYKTAKKTFKLNDDGLEPWEMEKGYGEVDFKISEMEKSGFCTLTHENLMVPNKYSLETLLSKHSKRGINNFLTDVSAYNPEEQQIWLDLKFRPVGYCPSWKRMGEERLDTIFMFKGELPDPKRIYYEGDAKPKGYERLLGTWFHESAKPLIETIYKFKE